MSDFVKETMDALYKKLEKREKLLKKSCFILCRSEHAFQQVCEAMFQSKVPKIMDCNIEVFYKSKGQILCVKWVKEKKAE